MMSTEDYIAGEMCQSGEQICSGNDPTKAWEEFKVHSAGCSYCQTALIRYYEEIGHAPVG